MIGDLINYLESVKGIPKNISPGLKALKTRIDDLYKDRDKIEVEDRSSTFRGFTKEYFIKGKGGFSPEIFLELAKVRLTDIMNNNRQTKVKFIMRCMMKHSKTNELKPINFEAAYPIVNLDGEDVSEIYDEMAK